MNSSLALDDFFPYQLARLQALISDAIAAIYSGEFNLSKQEWRILAILGNHHSITAKELRLKANLEKMSASRAIQSMHERKLLTKQTSPHDKRATLLTLSANGDALYRQLTPLVKQREYELLSSISDQEIASLKKVFSQLEHQAQLILERD